jgi:hypothetical protein
LEVVQDGDRLLAATGNSVAISAYLPPWRVTVLRSLREPN